MLFKLSMLGVLIGMVAMVLVVCSFICSLIPTSFYNQAERLFVKAEDKLNEFFGN